MINRFHSVSPSTVALTAGSQAKKINVGDGFGEMLNALISPLQQTEGQTPDSLPEEKNIDIEMPDAGIPFHILIGNTDNFVELSAVGNVLVPPTLTIPVMPMDSSLPKPTLVPVLIPTQPTADLLPVEHVSPEQVDNHNWVLPSSSTSMESPAIGSPISLNAGTVPTDSDMPVVSPVQSLPATDALTTSAMAAETIMTLDPEIPIHVVEVFDAKEAAPEPVNSEVRINKHASAVAGDVELVSMPWRLQANAALSYQSNAERLKNTENASNEIGMPPQTTPVRASNKGQLPNTAGYAAASENSEMDKSLAFYRVSEAASALVSVFENARVTRADSRASLVMWPQRVLHWLSDGDATTAWVRDYTLDSASTGTLVEALRCFSEQQGFTLRRIMLNGHEVWRAPSTF